MISYEFLYITSNPWRLVNYCLRNRRRFLKGKEKIGSTGDGGRGELLRQGINNRSLWNTAHHSPAPEQPSTCSILYSNLATAPHNSGLLITRQLCLISQFTISRAQMLGLCRIWAGFLRLYTSGKRGTGLPEGFREQSWDHFKEHR